LFNSYTQAFNKQQGRSGTLFEGRPKHVLVDTDAYIIHLCRYIHLNPVKAGLFKHPGDWPYSNYLEWGEQRAGALVDCDFVQQSFASPGEYEAFVMGDLESSIEQELKQYCID
jgi:hypothetical protein